MLELAGAAAGILTLVGLVGTAIMWARLRALDLPGGRGVSLLPSQYLLTLGGATLVLAMLVALVAIGVLHGLRRALPDEARHVAPYILSLTLGLLLLFAVFEMALTGYQRLFVLATGALAGAAFVVIAENVRSFRRLSMALFFLIAILGGVLGFARNLGAPVNLDAAVILLKDGSLTSGAYIATTSDEVYLAPDSFNRTYGQLVSIPRADITRISLSEPQGFRPAGERESTPLIGGGQETGSERVRQVEKYLAGWAGDPIWRYPPVSFTESESYLRSHLSQFVASRPQPWSKAGTQVGLSELVEGARNYSGQAVITRGKVVQLIMPPNQRGEAITQIVILEGGPEGQARVICAVTANRSRPRYRLGAGVEVRGVVVHAGTLAGHSDKSAKGVFMQCSATRAMRQRSAARTTRG